MWPRSCAIRIDTYQSKAHEFTASPTLPVGKWLVQVTGKILQAKMSEVANASNSRYAAFVARACTVNGASLGHTLVKTMIKDSTINYQQVEDANTKDHGVSVEARHHSRMCK